MKLNTAFDLHSYNSYLGIIDENGKRVFKKKLANDPAAIVDFLNPLRDDIVGIAVESTYNWYWLVDLLMAEGYQVHLANPAEIQKDTGLKYADDQHDAFWLTEMLRVGILPEGYIYPKEDRPVRDLLRKRGHLVRPRTSLIIRLQNIISRNNGIKLKVGDIKIVSTERVAPLLERNEDLALAGKVSKESIDFLTRKIKAIEAVVEKRVELREPYDRLLTEPGIGKILGLTVMLANGPISGSPKQAITHPTAGRYRANGSATRRRKAKGTRRAATSTLPGPFLRPRRSPGDMMWMRGPISTARRSKRTGWWRKTRWPTNWRELPTISCGTVSLLCRRNALSEGWLGR